ncbi:MAG: tRNA glutamyl-Q(34) synthetase GluQRS [Verrucomicrobiaceae bacterium]|nr:tRNA glutamyl-Q(34) synthetase GluQRS [Verrucomicrobiaceae bacterium]
MSVVTRFAPSPTGWLHLGHAFAALFAHAQAARAGGRFLIRLEDIDPTRVRPEYESAIYDDLAWLGLTWETPVRRQSEHFDDYRRALAKLSALGVLYPCFCTRKEIQDEIARAGQAPHGPDGPHYPGTCRGRPAAEAADRVAGGQPYALRLDVTKAASLAGHALHWADLDRGMQKADPAVFGDVVLARKETPASYHLAVVVDDAIQGITLVTRGEDLFEATHLHRLLQELLRLPVPQWRHHRLISDEAGRRLAKRDDARSLRALRELGWTPERVREAVGFST